MTIQSNTGYVFSQGLIVEGNNRTPVEHTNARCYNLDSGLLSYNSKAGPVNVFAVSRPKCTPEKPLDVTGDNKVSSRRAGEMYLLR